MIPNLRILKIIAGFGVSSFITQLSVIIAQFVLNNMLNMYGALSKFGPDIPLAVCGITAKIHSILNAMLVGIGAGSQPIVGYNYGAKNFRRTKRAYLTAAGAASVIAIVFYAALMLFPQPIINLFGMENELYNEFAHIAFRSFLLLVFLNGFQIVTGIFFQSIGKPVRAAIIVIARMFIAMIPMAIILPRFYGVTGILYSGAIADGLAFVVALTLSIIQIKKINKGILETEGRAVLGEL